MSTASSQMSEIAAAAEAMRRHALSFPETHEDFPWEDHRAVKVKGKAFLFMGMSPAELSFSVKLPQSRDIALLLPFAKPTGYGLGKSGWVSAYFDADAKPPVDMLLAWLDESYRAIAPKKLVAQLGASRQAAPSEATTNVKPAKAAKAAKAAAPAKAAKAAAPAKAAKAAKAAAPAKAAEAAKAAAPAKAAKATEPAKPAKVTKTAKPAKAPAKKVATKVAGGAARKARVPAT